MYDSTTIFALTTGSRPPAAPVVMQTLIGIPTRLSSEITEYTPSFYLG